MSVQRFGLVSGLARTVSLKVPHVVDTNAIHVDGGAINRHLA